MGMELDLRAIIDRGLSIGDAAGDRLLAFADAIVGADEAVLEAARGSLRRDLGDDALVGAAAVAGNFSRNDRIANAIGIPLEREFVQQSAELREALGIDRFPSAVNTPR
jgi:hypothetical protein